jgi:large subunit ribosomal protein L25
VKLAGGVVSHLITEAEVLCLPDALPEFIEVDLSKLEAGQTIHLSDLALPAGRRVRFPVAR